MGWGGDTPTRYQAKPRFQKQPLSPLLLQHSAHFKLDPSSTSSGRTVSASTASGGPIKTPFLSLCAPWGLPSFHLLPLPLLPAVFPSQRGPALAVLGLSLPSLKFPRFHHAEPCPFI